MPLEDVEERLYSCLANREWAAKVVSGRPYPDAASFISAAWIALNDLSDEDWLAALRAHPRIGARGGHTPATSEREQRQAMEAPASTLAALAADNRQYEDRFGHVFLIRASGRTGEEILSELRRRMKNDPAMEFAEARRELAQIVQLRLENLVSP